MKYTDLRVRCLNHCCEEDRYVLDNRFVFTTDAPTQKFRFLYQSHSFCANKPFFIANHTMVAVSLTGVSPTMVVTGFDDFDDRVRDSTNRINWRSNTIRC
jgi:hypothetical protein